MANTQIRAGNEKQTERKHLCGGYMSYAKSAEGAEIIIMLMNGLGLEISSIVIKSY